MIESLYCIMNDQAAQGDMGEAVDNMNKLLLHFVATFWPTNILNKYGHGTLNQIHINLQSNSQTSQYYTKHITLINNKLNLTSACRQPR